MKDMAVPVAVVAVVWAVLASIAAWVNISDHARLMRGVQLCSTVATTPEALRSCLTEAQR